MKEKLIETQILNYLSTLGGLALKLESKGRPIATKTGFILLPIVSRFSPKGMSDILYIRQGISHFMEVKKPTEMKFIMNNYDRLIDGNFGPTNKTYERYRNQIIFIEMAKQAGARAGFVSSIQDVQVILNG
jgi:hypothetical protein